MRRDSSAGAADPSSRLATMVDAAWFVKRYPDVALTDSDPAAYFVRQGAKECRDPNPFFDSNWYLRTYPDVGASGLDPVSHYLLRGITAGHNPHPRFDAAWYCERHPSAAGNPVLYHLRVGRHHGYATAPVAAIADCLPSTHTLLHPRRGVFADVIVRLRGDLASARRCLSGVLALRALPLARIIVFESPSCEPELAAWLGELSDDGQILRIPAGRDATVASCLSEGSDAAEGHDIIWIDAGAEVGFATLYGLAAHAHAHASAQGAHGARARGASRIASVSPLCNVAHPPLPSLTAFGVSRSEIETICRTVNAGRAVPIPTPEDACVYIRRDALQAVGGFRNTPDPIGDFAARATAAGWHHRLAADGIAWRHALPQPENSDAKPGAKPGAKPSRLTRAQPQPVAAAGDDQRDGQGDPSLAAAHYAVTAAIFRGSGLPVILMVCHAAEGRIRRHIDDLAQRCAGRAHMLLLTVTDHGTSLSVPGQADYPILRLPDDGLEENTAKQAAERALLLRSAGVTRVHIHHLPEDSRAIEALIHHLGVPFDVTVHDYHPLCPQETFLPLPEGSYCGEPGPAACNACIAASGRAEGHDIVRWRQQHAWVFVAAQRVICPSAEAHSRLARFGIRANTILVAHETGSPGARPVIRRPAPPADFYASDYLVPPVRRQRTANGTERPRPRIVIVPEQSNTGDVSAVASLRLLHPLAHPAIGGDCDVLLADPHAALSLDADLIVTHRRAVPDVAAADELIGYARASGAKLLYDLDDAVLLERAVGRGAQDKDAAADVVRHMLAQADAVWVDSQDLARRLGKHRPDAMVVPSRHDERLWPAPPAPPPYPENPVRLLVSTAGLRDGDIALIAPMLLELKAAYGERLVIDVLLVERPHEVPPGLNRIVPPVHAIRSYPAFVDWISAVRPGWQIGLAPLRDAPDDATMAQTTLLEYAALGLPILASDVPAYRGSVAEGAAGQLVRNDAASWHAALDWMIRADSFRRGLAAAARPAWEARGTLAATAPVHRAALAALLPAGRLRAAATDLIMQHDPIDTSAGKRGHRRRG